MMKKIKKTMTYILMIVMVVSFIPVMHVDAQNEILIEGDYKYYIEEDGTATLWSYLGIEELVEIPSEIGGVTVTRIGGSTFTSKKIKKVIVPDGVKEINNNSFALSEVEEIVLPNSVEKIERSAFYCCTNLKKINLPPNIFTIESQTFYGCTSLESVEIPSGVTDIEVSAFMMCSNLKEIKIPSSVETIGIGAFFMCTSIQSIDIPNGVTTIDVSAFYGCESLKNIEIPKSVVTIEDSVFQGCISLETVKCSNSIESIGRNAFYACTSLLNFDIPSSVTNIEDYAFYNCDSIKEIYISENVASIGINAFGYCNSLRNIDVNNSNPYYYSVNGNLYEYGNSKTRNYSLGGRTAKQESSGDKCIQYAIGKKNKIFTVPDGVTIIGQGAFSECKALQNIKKMEKLNTIEENAFLNCDNIEKIKIPKSVTVIGEDAIPTSTTIYSYPDSLAQTYAEENGNQFVEIGVKHITESPMELVDGAISFSLFKESPYASWEVFGNEGEKCAELINVEVGYGNNGVVMNENSLIVNYEDITEGITFEKSDYKSFIIPNEVVDSWEDAKINKMDIYLPEDEMGESCYISSVFGRTSGAGGKYIDLKREELKIIKGSKQDIIVSAVGVEEGDVYYILQDDTRKLTSDDGKFASEDLYNTLKGNIVTYAYVKKADGTITDPIELMLEKQELSEEEEAFLQLDGFNLFGDESSIEIADEVPIIGGAEITMDSVTKPIGIAVNDGKIRISLGVDIFEKDDGWGEELKWKEFKESFDTIDEVNDWIEDSLEALDAFDELAQSNGVKIDKGSEDDYSINVMGYAEGVITQDGIVFTDVGGQVAAQFVYEYTRQSAMWVLPTYFNVEFEGETCVTFDWFRVVPDSSLPLQFDFVADINPTLKLGGGIGVKDAVSAGLYGQGIINSSLDVGKKYAFLELEGEIGLEGEFFIISGSESIISGKVTAFDGYLGNNSLSLYSNNIINNRKLYNPLDSNIKYSLVSRDYLNSTSKWLSGSNVDEVTGNSKESGVNPYSMAQMDSAGVLNNRGASEIDVNIDSSNIIIRGKKVTVSQKGSEKKRLQVCIL